MDANALAEQMGRNVARIASLVDGVDVEQARWRPDPGSWSILEVVNHLYDEEREDFRIRLDIILHAPERDWPPIDPKGWVTARRYNERDLAESLRGFLAERESSLAWLRGLGKADWDASVEAPWGPFRAGDMLAAWASHDLLHMRQLVELHWAWGVGLAAPFDVRYAGDW